MHAVFLPFGAITFCNFIGQQSVIPALTGPITVRSALIEYKAASCAAECVVSMNGFSLGGVHLLVETVNSAMADTLKGMYRVTAAVKCLYFLIRIIYHLVTHPATPLDSIRLDSILFNALTSYHII